MLKKNLIPILLIIIIGAAAYANSLNGVFLWDDTTLVVNNAYIKDTAYVKNFFTEHIAGGSGRPSNGYRPLQMLSYMMDYSFWELDARGYHITSVVLHILAALAVFWLVNLLFKDDALSLVTAAIFVVHPLHTEAVAYVSGRADPLALVFTLLSIIFYIKALDSGKAGPFIVSLAAFLCALLSKENALILPLLLLLYHYAFKKPFKAGPFLPLAGLAFIYAALRLTVLNFPVPPSEMGATTVFQRVPGLFVSLSNYLRLLVVPIDLHMEYSSSLFSITHPKAIGGLIILALILFTAYRTRKKGGLVFFATMWFLITLLPQSNIYVVNANMAEHWLYAPMIGFLLLVAKAFVGLFKRKELRPVATTLCVAIIGVFSYLTMEQNRYWSDPIEFYARTVKYAPYSYRAQNNLGVQYYEAGRLDEAMEAYEKSIEIFDDYTDAHNNLGTIYFLKGRPEDALVSFRKALEIDPNHVGALDNVGNTLCSLGRLDEAIEAYEKAIKAAPFHALTYNNMGIAYDKKGDTKKAMGLFQKAIEIMPHYPEAHYNLGLAYYEAGRGDDAIRSLETAIRLKPDYKDAYNNLGAVLYHLGKKKESIGYFKKALKIDPGDASARRNLTIAEQTVGQE